MPSLYLVQKVGSKQRIYLTLTRTLNGLNWNFLECPSTKENSAIASKMSSFFEFCINEPFSYIFQWLCTTLDFCLLLPMYLASPIAWSHAACDILLIARISLFLLYYYVLHHLVYYWSKCKYRHCSSSFFCVCDDIQSHARTSFKILWCTSIHN